MKLPTITDTTIKKITAWKALVNAGGTHQPFVRVSDVRKMGRRFLFFCPKQKRPVHLLSGGEYRAYQMLIWLPSTLKINEQTPLDLNQTLKISAELGFLHPRDWKENTAHVMSTDFLVTALNRETKQAHKVAYSFKYSNQLYRLNNGELERHKLRTWQKLAIEAEYWRQRGVEYRIITEKDATKHLCINLDWFKTEYDVNVSEAELKDFCFLFIESWKSNNKLRIEHHLNFIRGRLNISFKHAQSIFKYAALYRVLPLDLSTRLMLNTPVKVVL
ncbi:MAG: hypothetical protein EOO53_12225 [Gammaproteobacteria bacterium]|nr:MAG: hypothetical protein EOO53_12225 [Gammaproteobacteria bacterium]